MTEKRLVIEYDRMVICEGREELGLVKKLIGDKLVRPISASFIGDSETPPGFDGLDRHLMALEGLPAFENIRSIGIIVDTDENPDAAFLSTIAAIQKANDNENLERKYSIPSVPILAASESDIAVSIFMSPQQEECGCMETVLLSVLRDTQPDLMKCIDQLIECSGIDSGTTPWAKQKVDKSKVRVAISQLCKRNPAVALSVLWERYPTLIPADHALFTPLRDFIDSIE